MKRYPLCSKRSRGDSSLIAVILYFRIDLGRFILVDPSKMATFAGIKTIVEYQTLYESYKYFIDKCALFAGDRHIGATLS